MQRIVREESRLQRGAAERRSKGCRRSGSQVVERWEVWWREGKRGEGVRRWRKMREECRREKGEMLERDASRVEREMAAVVERE